MAVKKVEDFIKAKTKKKKLKNGITLKRNKNGEYYFHLVWGKEISRVSETYKRKATMLKALRRTYNILYEYFIMENTGLFHDETKD